MEEFFDVDGQPISENALMYSISPLLTKNAILNFVLSMRGPGKTYQYKKYAITDYLKTGQKFLYVRRHKKEFNDIQTFFNDQADRFPDHSFRVKGGKDGGNFYIDDKQAGAFLPLSTALQVKSSDYKAYNKLCLDEFIVPKSTIHYLPNEAFSFFDLVETVNRMRLTNKLHDILRVFLFANTISVVNPYFSFLGITPDTSKRFTIPEKFNHDCVIEIYKNNLFTETKNKTRWGALMQATPYGQYAIDGDFYADSDAFISKLPPGLSCIAVFGFDGKHLGFWFDDKRYKIYASKRIDQNCRHKFSLTADDHKPQFLLVRSIKNVMPARVIVESFRHGELLFETQEAKQDAIRVINILGGF